ncbi:30S ribosomal protein S6 [bacterium]|nr:MAG: 30S ribosomal protein S6 [bacterium]
MNKYEGLFIVKPDLSEDERKKVFDQIADSITKNNGKVNSANIWSEKRKLTFPIKKFQDGLYYVVDFNMPPEGITKINYAYKLSESVIRFLIINKNA